MSQVAAHIFSALVVLLSNRRHLKVLDLKFSCIVDIRISDTDVLMARRFVAPLNDSEQQTLSSTYYHGKQRALWRRAHAILLSD